MSKRKSSLIDSILETFNFILEWKYLDRISTVKLINIGAIALYIDFQIDSITSLINTNQSILLWKITKTGEHHLLDFTAIILSFFILCIIFYKNPNPKIKRIFALFAFFTNYTLVGLHESAWYIGYYISSLIYGYYVNPLWIIDSRLPFYIILIISYLLFARKGLVVFPKRTLVLLTIFYMFWISIGFPVTIDYYGHTLFYSNIDVNLIEQVSWFIPIFAFLVESYRYLTLMVNKSKLASQPILTLGNNPIAQESPSPAN